MIVRTQSKPYAMLAVVWMGVIYLLSSHPAGDFPPLSFGADKLVHFVVFGILALRKVPAVHKEKPFDILTS